MLAGVTSGQTCHVHLLMPPLSRRGADQLAFLCCCRCGHTLTTIAGPDGDLSSAKLVLFGGCCCAVGWHAGTSVGRTRVLSMLPVLRYGHAPLLTSNDV